MIDLTKHIAPGSGIWWGQLSAEPQPLVHALLDPPQERASTADAARQTDSCRADLMTVSGQLLVAAARREATGALDKRMGRKATNNRFLLSYDVEDVERMGHSREGQRSTDAPLLAGVAGAPATSAKLLAERMCDELYLRRPAPGTYLFGLSYFGRDSGFGPSVVREALQYLSAMGLVEIRRGPKGGVYARHVGPEVVSRSLGTLVSMNGISRQTVIEARIEIEGLCARLAAIHATEDDIRRLNESITRAKAIGSDSAAFAVENVTFHLAIAEATHNDVVVALTHSVRDLFFDETVSFAYQPDALQQGLLAHERLLEEISNQNCENAVRLMRSHVHEFNRYVEDSGQVVRSGPLGDFQVPPLQT